MVVVGGKSRVGLERKWQHSERSSGISGHGTESHGTEVACEGITDADPHPCHSLFDLNNLRTESQTASPS